jgi:hypothetical protein
MQMSKLYYKTNKRVRAAALRTSANLADRAGYPGFAEVDRLLADWLDPPPREVRDPRQSRQSRHNGETPPAPSTRPHKPIRPARIGPDPSRAGGQRDAPPKRVERPGSVRTIPVRGRQVTVQVSRGG